mgnify:FL=1
MRGKLNSTIYIVCCIFLAFLAGTLSAETHYVYPGGSIQGAINSAINGDYIEVAAGTYTEAINFNGKSVHVYSSNGPEVTTINGTGHYHAVQCVNGEDSNSILEGFTITGGIASGAYPDDRGGGMLNLNSSPSIIECFFSNNVAWYGG